MTNLGCRNRGARLLLSVVLLAVGAGGAFADESSAAEPAAEPPDAAARPDREIRVDCDRGQDLGAALRRAEARGVTTVRFRGTCRGQLVITTGFLRLVGVSPQESRIIGGAGHGLYVRNPGSLSVENLSISESLNGIDVAGSERDLSVVDCEISGNQVGLRASFGARVGVLRSSIHSNLGEGLWAEQGSWVGIDEGTIRDNSIGVRTFQSFVRIVGSEVTGHSAVGVLAESLSTLAIGQATFFDNGDVHVAVTDRSSAELGDSPMGSESDPTRLALGAVRDSKLELFYTGADEIFGDVLLGSDSSLSLEGTILHGAVTAEEFSWLKLTDATAEGLVTCQSGADVLCGPGSSASTSGCGSVALSCGPASPNAPPLGSDPPGTLEIPTILRHRPPIPASTHGPVPGLWSGTSGPGVE